MNLGNYQTVEQVGTVAGGTLHLARHVRDGTPVLLKFPSHDSVAGGLRHEYALLQSLDASGILKPIALHEDGARLALVLEPFAGESLEAVLARQQRFTLPEALAIAGQMAGALAALHAGGIVHRDIRPTNFLLAHDGVQVKLADLSRAAVRDSATSTGPPAVIDWAYVSPEQTGRMNRQADNRADFYALGITLYRLLTGQLPFQADDPLEWVHCHLARMPVSPRGLVPDIPEVVSDLVLKLVAKVPEERYQSASGLLADVERCLAEWQASGEIAPFVLGMRDVSDRFQLPHKLYGRERERAALLAVFERVATTGTPMLVTVAGYSGVGKSSLINELQQPITERRGYFIAGKFDQVKRDIPYAILAQAFDGLVRQILGESDANIAHWRDVIREALGPNGQLLVSLIPQLELVIGPQPSVPDLSAQEVQARFRLVLRRFIGVFAKREHPLVLFLDDLQWVDTGTLPLLADLATHPDVHYLLLIGAYRDNEVGAAHPLMHSLGAIRQVGGVVQSIVLAPLVLDDVVQFVAELLHCPLNAAQPLAQLVLEKTGGNPFFTRQFLTALAEEKLVDFDASHCGWRWDLPRIHAKGYTNNVVDLLVGKLARLPPKTQDALTLFACLGHAADAATLGLVLAQSEDGVRALLWEAERAGLVYRQDDIYTFLHDRVQETAYSLIPEASQARMHLVIGRILSSRLAPGAVAERIFEVVNQLNHGAELVESREERKRIAELNLLAAQRAKAAAAYAPALAYLRTGAGLLAEDDWTRQHELVFAFELGQAECEFLTGALAESEARLTTLSTRAANTVEQAAVTCLRVDLYTTINRTDLAVAVGLDYLRQMGIDWSQHPTDEDVRREYEQIWSKLGDRAIEDLIDLPWMGDRESLATLDVLTKIIPPVHQSGDNLLLCFVMCRTINLSLDRGNSDSSCVCYASFSVVVGSYFGDYAAALRFGQLGLDLMERRGLSPFKARVYVIYAIHIVPWMRPIQSAWEWMQRAFDALQQTGDLTFEAYHYRNVVTLHLTGGTPLAEVQREAEAGLDFARRAGFGHAVDAITLPLQLVRTLRGAVPVFGSLNGAGFDESRFEQHILEENLQRAPVACWYWIRKLQARFFAGDHAAATEAAEKASGLLWTSPAFLDTVEYHYCGALSRAAWCDDAAPDERQQHRETLAAHHRQLQVWEENCPDNFATHAALVGAEIARLDGRELDAERLYEQAVRTACDSGFIHNEAIANEFASRFYATRGFKKIAKLYLQDARDAYLRWGADAKVRQLEAQHPWLRVRTEEQAASTPAENQVRLDLLAVAKASQAISGQILLDELVDTLMRLVLESAGAQTGYLLLAQGDALTLMADARVEQQTVQVRRHAGQSPSQGQLPIAMLQYVRRSREPVLLMEAAERHSFATDPYFAQQHPQSVLCLPILRQSALVGILYLENSLATHAFTPDRVQVLELLASQAAISIDNARLYADVRDSHARIRRLVESNIIGIFFWDLSGNITDANDAFLRMLGYERQDLLAGEVNWERMTLAEYRALDVRKVAELREARTCVPYEKEFLRNDGSRVPVLIGAVLFDDSPDHGVAFVLDLSERKRAETEREARHAAEAANRAKSAFLANMSHELRTPLNGILGYAEILERDPALGERQLNGVNVIRKSGEHLLTLINDILDLAKIESGKMELYPVDIQLARFVQTIIEIVGVKMAEKGLMLVCELSPDLPQGVRADEKRLRQVLLNLLANASKFTDHGRITLRVRFGPPARLAFEVQDTGVGIAIDQLDSIFEPFEQAGEMRRRQAGTGLGLAISRKYVRLMGGDIQVESRPGQGSIFRFEVQAQPVQVAPTVATTKAVTGYIGPRRKVLVVDDIADNRAVVSGLLIPLGFEVAEAANGREGVELAQRLRPDLIVMDIAMPVMDGLAATRLLRKQEAFREVPIVAMSASVSASDSEQSLAAGMNAFLVKPLEADNLLEQVAGLLQLAWVGGPEQAESPPEEGPIVAPPAEEMEVLYRLAQMGDMLGITARADRLAQLDEHYRPFANRLKSLAGGYQSKAVLRLVEEHRTATPDPQRAVTIAQSGLPMARQPIKS
ncbi:AAA family ATPase [Massilia sp. GER05]|uniref:AAA family ATPase n=1 Tax=Massilia sp. GER05 TaxID=3394605 RepID=UPI003F87BD23